MAYLNCDNGGYLHVVYEILIQIQNLRINIFYMQKICNERKQVNICLLSTDLGNEQNSPTENKSSFYTGSCNEFHAT